MPNLIDINKMKEEAHIEECKKDKDCLCEYCKDINPVTKDELIAGYLKLYASGKIQTIEIIIQSIKKVVLDNIVNWK